MTLRRPAVLAEDLRKRYGETVALDGFSVSVGAGSVCGLLGPNGAGKTTAVRILTTLLRPDSGRAQVAGYDITTQAAQVRAHIGLVGQHAAVDEVLSGRQNLVLFGRLFHLDAVSAGRRADELLAQFGLADAAGRPVGKYSGGMRRRLDLAASLILAPQVLFLDEPTTGLDPRGRSEVWTALRALVDGGTTVLLTTQYLDEADQLADHVVVIDAGRVIAENTPERLKARIGGDRIDIMVRGSEQVTAATALVSRVIGAEPEVDRESGRVSVAVRDRTAALTGIVRALDGAGIVADDIALRRPTLDEVFLHLTGRHVTSGREVPG
jgi:ABC-2 type transport system ATP-binding protein